MRELGLARRKYRWTPELDALLRGVYREARRRGELSRGLGRLAALRPAWPREVWAHRAIELGLTRCGGSRRWTEAEDRRLREMLGRVSTRQIAMTLGRSWRAVQSRASLMGTSGRVRDGFTVADLAECFGVSRAKASGWVNRGMFGRRGERIGERQVARFIREHGGEYDLRRVDQVWFLAMAFEVA